MFGLSGRWVQVRDNILSEDSVWLGATGCFSKEIEEGGSVPHPGLDAASSGKASAPDPGSPSPTQPQSGSVQRPGWPEPQQRWSRKGKVKQLIHDQIIWS